MSVDRWLVPALMAVPLGLATLARLRGAPGRLARVLAPLAGLALGALALWRCGSGGALGWELGAGAWRAGFVLDRAAAWMALLIACLAALAAAAAGAAPAPRRGAVAVRVQAFACLATVSCLSANLAWQLSAYVAAAAAAAAALARLRAPEAVRLWLVLGCVALAFALALGCLARGAGSFDAQLLTLSAPAATGADALWLTAAAYLLLAGLAAAAVLLPLSLALPALAPAPLRLAGLVLGGLAAWLLMRQFTLVFPCFTAGPCGAVQAALPLGLAAMSGAALATLLARSARELAAFVVVLLLALQLVAVGSFRVGGFAAAVYGLGHALLAGGALLLAAEPGPRRPGLARALLPATLVVAVCAPPGAGFVGLVAILRASGPDALAGWTLTAVALLLVAAAIQRLLGEPPLAAAPAGVAPRLWPAALALGASLALGLAARPGFEYALAAAHGLFDRAGYAAVATGVGSAAAARHYPDPAPFARPADREEGT